MADPFASLVADSDPFAELTADEEPAGGIEGFLAQRREQLGPLAVPTERIEEAAGPIPGPEDPGIGVGDFAKLTGANVLEGLSFFGRIASDPQTREALAEYISGRVGLSPSEGPDPLSLSIMGEAALAPDDTSPVLEALRPAIEGAERVRASARQNVAEKARTATGELLATGGSEVASAIGDPLNFIPAGIIARVAKGGRGLKAAGKAASLSSDEAIDAARRLATRATEESAEAAAESARAAARQRAIAEAERALRAAEAEVSFPFAPQRATRAPGDDLAEVAAQEVRQRSIFPNLPESFSPTRKAAIDRALSQVDEVPTGSARAFGEVSAARNAQRALDYPTAPAGITASASGRVRERSLLARMGDWTRSQLIPGSTSEFRDGYLRRVAATMTQDKDKRAVLSLARVYSRAESESAALMFEFDQARRDIASAITTHAKATGREYTDISRRMNEARRSGNLDTLPPDLREPVRKAGEIIDRHSQRFIDEGMISGDMAKTFRDNMGRYLNVSHDAFDVKGWAKRVEGTAVFDNAFNYLRKREEYADLSDAQIAGKVYEIANKDPEAMSAFVRNPMRIRGDELRHSKDIPKPIRALLGLREDVITNFDRSAALMIGDLESNAFLRQSRRVLQDNNLVFPRATKGDRVGGNFTTKVEFELAGGKRVVGYTTDEIASIFQAQKKSFRGYLTALNGITKMFKTVGSVETQTRNFVSGFLLYTATGLALNPVRTARNLGKALRGGALELSGGAVQREMAPLMQRAKQLGLIGKGSDAGEYARYAEDVSRMFGGGQKSTGIVGKVRGAVNTVKDVHVRAYAVGDDFWKMLAWRTRTDELRGIIKSEADLDAAAEIFGVERRAGMSTEEFIEELAAEYVKDTFQHYPRTSPIARSLSRLPPVGTFVSFTLEVPRNLINALRYGAKEAALARITGNPAWAGAAIKKAGGVAGALSAFTAAQEFGKMSNGLDQDHIWALNELSPWPWEINTEKVVVSTKEVGDDLEINFLSGGASDPTNVVKNPVIALFQPGSLEDRLVRAAIEVENALLGKEIFLSSAMEVVAGHKADQNFMSPWLTDQTFFGGEIRDTGDPTFEQAADTTKRFFEQVSPGSFRTAQDFAKLAREAAGGPEAIRGGRKLTLRDKVSSVFGVRTYTVSRNRWYREWAKRLAKRRSDISGSRNDKIREANSLEAYEKAIADANRRFREEVENHKKKIAAARKWGMSDEQIRQALAPPGGSVSVGLPLAGLLSSDREIPDQLLFPPPPPFRPRPKFGR